MINDKSQKFVQEGEVDFIIELFKLGLHENDTLVIGCIPDISQVVYSLTPLVDKKWGRLRITRLDPVWEKTALVCLIPQVLIQISIGDLLERLDIVNGNQMRVEVHKLNTHLLEGTMTQ
jgi:hypothetical protein